VSLFSDERDLLSWLRFLPTFNSSPTSAREGTVAFDCDAVDVPTSVAKGVVRTSRVPITSSNVS